MAPYSSILAWIISWTEEPCGVWYVAPTPKSKTWLKRLIHACLWLWEAFPSRNITEGLACYIYPELFWILKPFNINFLIILKQRFQVANFFVMPFTIRWLRDKESACQAGDVDSISGLGRSPREGNGNPFQHDSLGNSMDRVAWKVPWGRKESGMT